MAGHAGRAPARVRRRGAGEPSRRTPEPQTTSRWTTPPSSSPEALAPAASCAPVSIAPNPPDDCGEYVRLPCGLPAGVVPGSNCYLFINDCKKICPGFYFNCHSVNDSCKDGKVVPDAKGGIDIDCSICAKGVGRIPAGLAPARVARALSALGDWFAAAAHLEAASVHAFRRLHDELAAHGAPARLLRAARRAQRDEVRHARLTARMARRFGGHPVPPRVAPVPLRALEACGRSRTRSRGASGRPSARSWRASRRRTRLTRRSRG